MVFMAASRHLFIVCSSSAGVCLNLRVKWLRNGRKSSILTL